MIARELCVCELRHLLGEETWNVRGAVGNGDAGSAEGGDFAFRGAGVAGDDGARMPEAFALRGRATTDKRDGGLIRHVLSDERGGVLFIRAPDFAGDDDRVGLGIVRERFEAIDERGADDRVATDADARRLAETSARETVDDFIRERARARDHADAAFFEHVARHDTDERLARRDQSGAIAADDSHAGCRRDDAHHVVCGNAFGDADRELNTGVVRFPECIGARERRNEDDRVRRAGGFDGFFDGIEDRLAALDLRAAFAGRYAADDVRAVREHAARVKESLAAGDALHDDFGIFIEIDRHELVRSVRKGDRARSAFVHRFDRNESGLV